MSLYRKLILFMLASTVIPFAIVGFYLVRESEDALRTRITASHTESVRAEADSVAVFINEQVDEIVRAASLFDLTHATQDELVGAVRVLYRSAPQVAIAVILDAEGKPVVMPEHLVAPSSIPELVGRPTRDAPAVQRLLEKVREPLQTAIANGLGTVVISEPYLVPEAGECALALAIPVTEIGPNTLAFGAEISLGRLQRRVAERLGDETLALVDNVGRFLAHPKSSMLRVRDDTPIARHALAAEKPTTARFEINGKGVLAAFAPVPLDALDWAVMMTLPEDVAFAQVRRMRVTILGASGATILALVLLGGFLIRGMKRGLSTVTEGAVKFSRGELDHRITPPPEEELYELATTFNTMGEQLAAARTRLERWNEELQEQVEIRTSELKTAQAQLLQTQKLAAVAQLGAGVAHEINNPLAGILGNVQLLILKLKKEGSDEKHLVTLAKVEEAAKRCREITKTLLKFSQQTETASRSEIPLNDVVTDALNLSASQVAEQGARVETQLEEPSPLVNADPGHISQVLLHLLSNARIAVSGREDGVIRVTTSSDEGTAQLKVTDNGRGIDEELRDRIFEPFLTTKDEWNSLGLGLSVAFRIIEDHGGRIDVESTVGKGSEFTVSLPLVT